MGRNVLIRQFRRIYPECSLREIEDLVSAILSDKYWRVHPEKPDAIYTVALSRARTPCKCGFKARCTGIKLVSVSLEASKFVKKGRILVAVKSGAMYHVRTVMLWPVFLKLFHLSPDKTYVFLVKSVNSPPFIGRRNINRLVRDLGSATHV